MADPFNHLVYYIYMIQTVNRQEKRSKGERGALNSRARDVGEDRVVTDSFWVALSFVSINGPIHPHPWISSFPFHSHRPIFLFLFHFNFNSRVREWVWTKNPNHLRSASCSLQPSKLSTGIVTALSPSPGLWFLFPLFPYFLPAHQSYSVLFLPNSYFVLLSLLFYFLNSLCGFNLCFTKFSFSVSGYNYLMNKRSVFLIVNLGALSVNLCSVV